VTPPSPRRGEIWLVDFSPARGSEQAGIRPALVIQNDVGNQFAATTIVAAVTSTMKVYPVTVALQHGEGGLRKPSIVNLALVLTIDKTRLQRRLGALPPRRMEAVNGAIRVSLDVE
jgi:mRNA interferase MazF